MQIYKSILYVTRMTQNKNDSINSVLQHGRVVDNNCCCGISCFKISIFDPVSQIVQMETIWDHLSGTKIRVWICSEYDAAFNFHCISLWNLTKSFSFSFISFLSKESDSKSFKLLSCTLYASEILLIKVFIDSCKLTGEIPID